MSYRHLEKEIRKKGLEIYSLMAGDVPSLFDRRRWKGKVIGAAMEDETFKTQLFRFIDVLPCLKSDDLLIRLFREYFVGIRGAPAIIQQGLRRTSREDGASPLACQVIRTGVTSLARDFIAGQTCQDISRSLGELRKAGHAVSLDVLGEDVLSDSEAAEYTARCSEFLSIVGPEAMKWQEIPLLDRDDKGPLPRLDLSIKVSSFYCQIDPLNWEGSVTRAKDGLRPLFRMSERLGASITVDMEHYYLKGLTIAIFKGLLEEERRFEYGGIALQAYLKDTREDLLELVEWARKNRRRVTVRLVKGAYGDYERVTNRQKGWSLPVFHTKEETDSMYEELTKILLENTDAVRPAFATHNLRSISHAIAAAEALGLPREAYEFQMLYGMADPLRKALQRLQYRVRIYTPAGELIPGMAYLIRRLLESTSSEAFLRRSFSDRVSLDELIKAPTPSPAMTEVLPSDRGFRNEPPLDFSLSANREKVRKALSTLRESLGKRYPLFLGSGEAWAERESLSLNPARPKEVIGRVSSALQGDAERALDEARRAWKNWRRTTPGERSSYLFRAAEEMRMRRFDLIALEICEVGKTWRDADGDVSEAIDYLEYYGREMERLGSPRRLGAYPGERNDYLYEPKGVGVVLSPWNFPLAIPTGMVSAAIVTGNCVILKPSGLSPVTGWKLVETFRKAGLPPGVLQFLPGPGQEVGEYLVSHREVDFIAFTGSEEVGLRIVKHAGETLPGQRNIKRVIAEMGGKNAIIVDGTADLDEAVRGILESALGFQGQKCSACSRVIVVGDLFAPLCLRLKEAMASIPVGNPEEPQNLMGPVIDRAAREKIARYIEMGQREGTAETLGKAPDEGFFIGPVVIGDVSPDSPLGQEEIFGPVLLLMRARDIGEALELANRTRYALTGGVFSRSPATIDRVEEELRVGNLYINRRITGALVGRQPFGGFGMSGVGSKAGGPDYLLQFLNPKSVSENTLRRGFAPGE